MIYTANTKKALKLCFEVHKSQVDKSGVPYVFHPVHLAEQMENEEAIIVALLHDVIEDSDYTLKDITQMGFSEKITEALSLLTHKHSEPYMEYIAKLKDNSIARVVKLADLEHNSDLSQLDVIDDRALKQNKKYQTAIRLLQESTY